MLKWIVSLIVIICSVYIGSLLKKSYKRRGKLFSDYERFICYCTERISTSLTPIDELKKAFLCDKDFQSLLKGDKCEIISKREYEELESFINGIGKSDCENTLSILSKEREHAHSLKEKGDDEIKKKGDLYFKLSIILGLAIALVI